MLLHKSSLSEQYLLTQTAEPEPSSTQHSGDTGMAALPSPGLPVPPLLPSQDTPPAAPPYAPVLLGTAAVWGSSHTLFLIIKAGESHVSRVCSTTQHLHPTSVQTNVFKCTLTQTNSNDNRRHITTSVRHSIPTPCVI